MIQSMTAFASRAHAEEGQRWNWEIRSVNARGLDIRLRLPDGIDGFEVAVREAITKRFARGNITLNLKLGIEDPKLSLDVDQEFLGVVLKALKTIEQSAGDEGLALSTPTAADILSIKGVLAGPERDTRDHLRAALLADLAVLLDDFSAMRRTEGAALAKVITRELDQLERLIADAKTIADDRRDDQRASIRAAMERVMANTSNIDADRVEQELALIAVKADVTEELDRLGVHIAAARALLTEGKPIGRKFDFLSQEFNREANTLCSKAQSSRLTATGLEIKAVIEKIREQVQNVE